MTCKYIFLTLLIFFNLQLFSQREESNFSTKYGYFGFGWIRVDDNASAYPDFSRSETNHAGYPSLLTLGKVFNNGVKLDGSVFYTPLNKSTYGGRYDSPGVMTACDVNFGYAIKIIGGSKEFSSKKKLGKFSLDFYPSVGGGYAYRSLTVPSLVNSATCNFGGGINLWSFKNKLGLNLQALSKFGIKQGFPNNGSNYIQYSFSMLYRVKRSDSSLRNLNQERGKF